MSTTAHRVGRAIRLVTRRGNPPDAQINPDIPTTGPGRRVLHRAADAVDGNDFVRGCGLPTTGSRLPTRLPIPGSRIPDPGSPIPDPEKALPSVLVVDDQVGG